MARMSLLVVELPSPGGLWSVAEFSDAGVCARVESAPLAQLGVAWRGAAVSASLVAVVPPERISWHRLPWPKAMPKTGPKLLQAIVGMLEDRVLGESSEMHWALGPSATAADGSAEQWVAAIEKHWLAECLGQIKSAGRSVSRVVALAEPLADAPNGAVVGAGGERRLHAYMQGERGQLLVQSAQGVVSWPLEAAGALGIVQDDGASGTDLGMTAEPAAAALAQRALVTLAADAASHLTVRQRHELLLHAATVSKNLAQFDIQALASNSAAQRWQNAWREAVFSPSYRLLRLGVLALLATNVLALNALAWQEKLALTVKKQAIFQTFTQTFPDVKTVIDAPAQMRRQVATLRQSQGALSVGDAEPLLAAWGELAKGDPSLAPAAGGGLEFSGDALRISGLSGAEAAVAAAGPQAAARGWALTSEAGVLVLRAGPAP